jgi:hypothetical protein
MWDRLAWRMCEIVMIGQGEHSVVDQEKDVREANNQWARERTQSALVENIEHARGGSKVRIISFNSKQ